MALWDGCAVREHSYVQRDHDGVKEHGTFAHVK